MIIYTILYKNHPKQRTLSHVVKDSKELALDWIRGKMSEQELEINKILEINLTIHSIDEVALTLNGHRLDFRYKAAPKGQFDF